MLLWLAPVCESRAFYWAVSLVWSQILTEMCLCMLKFGIDLLLHRSHTKGIISTFRLINPLYHISYWRYQLTRLMSIQSFGQWHFVVLHLDISILGKHVASFYLSGPAHFCKTFVPILINQMTTACIITCIFIWYVMIICYLWLIEWSTAQSTGERCLSHRILEHKSYRQNSEIFLSLRPWNQTNLRFISLANKMMVWWSKWRICIVCPQRPAYTCNNFYPLYWNIWYTCTVTVSLSVV